MTSTLTTSIQTITKASLARLGVYGALIAAGGLVISKTLEQRDLDKAVADARIADQQKYHELLLETIRKIEALQYAELGELRTEDDAYRKRQQQITKLDIDRGQMQLLATENFRLHEMQKTEIVDEQERKRTKALEDTHDFLMAIADDEINEAERQAAQEKQLRDERLSATSTMFGNLAIAAKAFGKKGFAIWKAMAISQAIVDTYRGATAAFAALAGIPYVGPVLGVAAAAAAIAAGLANVATISGTKFEGQAHSGLDSVPSEGTYLLQRGERIVQPDQNERLTEFLDNQSGGGGGALYIDGTRIGQVLWNMSRNGQLKISARAIV